MNKPQQEYVSKAWDAERAEKILIQVMVKDFKMEYTSFTPVYTNVFSILSEVGGLMGLFLGISAMTLIESFEFLMGLIFYATCCKPCKVCLERRARKNLRKVSSFKSEPNKDAKSNKNNNNNADKQNENDDHCILAVGSAKGAGEEEADSKMEGLMKMTAHLGDDAPPFIPGACETEKVGFFGGGEKRTVSEPLMKKTTTGYTNEKQKTPKSTGMIQVKRENSSKNKALNKASTSNKTAALTKQK